MSTKHTPLDKLKHHVTGAIERGEATAIESHPVAKHTPGPWVIKTQYKVLTNVVRNVETRIPYYEVGTELRVLAKLDTGMNDEANARLIACAPEMLEALELVLSNNRLMNALDVKTRRAVMDAIAKATGGAE